MSPLTLDDIPVLILLVDRHHRIKYTNAKSEEIVGYKAEELKGENISILLPEPSNMAHASMIDSYFMEPSNRPLGMGRDLRARHKSGELKQVEIGLSYVIVLGEPCALAVIIDIEVRKSLESMAVNTQFLAKLQEQTLKSLDEHTISISAGRVACNEPPTLPSTDMSV